MTEFKENPKRKKPELKPGAIVFNSYGSPRNTPAGCKWVPEEVHVDKGYVISWRLEEIKPAEGSKYQSPMYPTEKSPREDVPMGGIPRGDRD